MTIKEFIDLYNNELQNRSTAYLAYMEAEAEHIRIAGERKFCDYQSFKSAKSRYLRGIKSAASIARMHQAYLLLVKKFVPAEEQDRWKNEWNKLTD